MGFIYKKIEKIEGPLLFIKHKHAVSYGTIVKIKTPYGEVRNGRVLVITEDYTCIEVFQGTEGLEKNIEISFSDELFTIGISKDMMGNTFDGQGRLLDLSGNIKEYNIIPEVIRDINGSVINPIMRDFPKDIIQTGISVIDGLNSLIRGQKLPIFTSQGLPHNSLVAQIIKQAKVITEESFLIIFVGIGIVKDDAMFFIERFNEAGVIQNLISFINLASDPSIERILIPRIALTVAEYFAFDLDMHVLVIMNDMTNYCEALRELSSAKGEIPSRKGFPGYMYSDLASIYERAGKIVNKNGTITQIPIVSMPNDDITHPIPDLTGYITEGQLVLSKELYKKGIYPPIDILSSLSRLMKDGVGAGKTREDHLEIANLLNVTYSKSLDTKDLESIIGEDSLSKEDKQLLNFSSEFEKKFVNQNYYINRDIEQTLNIAWKLANLIPSDYLVQIDPELVKKYLKYKM